MNFIPTVRAIVSQRLALAPKSKNLLETRTPCSPAEPPSAVLGQVGFREVGQDRFPDWPRPPGWRQPGWVPLSKGVAPLGRTSEGAALESLMSGQVASHRARLDSPSGDVARGTGFAAEQERVIPPRKHPRPSSEEMGT